MRILSIITIILIYCKLPFAQEDTLGSDYNLGRVTGKGVNMNNAGLYINDGMEVADVFHGQIGKDDIFSFGYTIGGFANFADDGGIFAILFPEFDLHAKIGASNRIKVINMPFNIFFGGGDDGGFTGFQSPFFMLNVYNWSFLTNKGQITLPQNQREHGFFFGPLLNSKQLRIDAGMIHTIREDNSDYSIIAPDVRVLFGILDNFQIGTDFK